MLRTLTAAAVILGLGAGVAAAAEPGERFTGHFPLAGKRIPLPAGEWVLAGRHETAPFAGAVLVTLSEGRVRGFVLATTNTEPGAAGWGLTRDCGAAGPARAAVAYASAVDGACWFAGRVALADGPGRAPAWVAALDRAERQGWSVPAGWLMAGVRVTDRRDVVDVRYHVLGTAVDGAAAWAEQALPAVERGLRNRLEDAAPLPALPPPAPALAARTAPEPSGWSADWSVGLMKTVSWRVVGTAGDLAVAYLFTGDPVLSGGLAATGAVLNSVLYFGHELAWNRNGAALLELPGAAAFVTE